MGRSRREAPLPRATLASTALASLNALSPHLPPLHKVSEALLLHSPDQTRATLPQPQQDPLSEAVVLTAHCLTPVFPLTHAQNVFNWLAQSLELSKYGSDAELNAVLCAALPYHATNQFVTVCERLVAGKGLWRFLEPVVKQKLPPDMNFVVRYVPVLILKQVILHAVHCVKLCVPTTQIASFVTNVVGRRISRGGDDLHTLVLACAEALGNLFEMRKKHFSKSHGEEKAVQAFDDAFTELVCAFYVCISAAVATAHKSDSYMSQQVLEALLSACQAGMHLHLKSVSETAVRCMQLCVRVGGKLSLAGARKVVYDGKVCKRLENLSATEVYESCVLVLVKEAKTERRLMTACAALEHANLLSDRVLQEAIINLLGTCAESLMHPDGGTGDRDEEQRRARSRMEVLSKALTPIARGGRAEVMDKALRRHFDARKSGRSTKRKHQILDDAIASAVVGTKFEVVSTNGTTPATMCGMLAHPETSVRRAALKRLRGDVGVREGLDSAAVADVGVLVMGCLTDDNVTNASLALESLSVKPFCDQLSAETILGTVLGRMRTFSSSRKGLKKKARKKFDKGFDGFRRSSVEFCECATGSMASDVMYGLAVAGWMNGLGEEHERKIWGLFEREMGIKKSEGELAQAVVRSTGGLISRRGNVAEQVFDRLACIDEMWALRLARTWIEAIEGGKGVDRTGWMLSKLVSMFEESRKKEVCQSIVDVLVTPGNIFIKGGDCGSDRLDSFWSVVSAWNSTDVIMAVLKDVVEHHGVSEAVDMLRRNSTNTKSSFDARSCSMQWYLNMCVVHPDKSIRKQFVLTMCAIVYGDDKELSAFVKSLFRDAINGMYAKKKERSTRLWAFVEMVAALPDNRWEDPGVGSDVLARGLHEEYFSYLSRDPRHPAPLSVSPQCTYDGAVHELIVDHVLGDDVDDITAVSLLRCLHGYSDVREAYAERLFSAFKRVVQDVDVETGVTDVQLEIVARLCLMQAALPGSNVTGKKRNMAKKIVQQLSAVHKRLKSESSVPVRVTTVLACVGCLAVRMLHDSKPAREVRQVLLAQVLAFSVKASQAGACIRAFLNSSLGAYISLGDVNHFIADLKQGVTPSTKKARSAGGEFSLELQQFRDEAGLGALEAVLRWLRNNGEAIKRELSSLQALKATLWAYLKQVLSKSNDRRGTDELFEYAVAIAMDALSHVHRLEPKVGKTERCEDLQLAVDSVFYPSEHYEGEETALITSVRRAALGLLEVLAPVHGGEMQTVVAPVVKTLISRKNKHRSLTVLIRLVPALVDAGCEFERVCTWLADAGYKHGHFAEHEARRNVMAECCLRMPDVHAAVEVCLRQVSIYTVRHMGLEDAAKECASFLQCAGRSTAADLKLLKGLDSSIRCPTTKVYIGQSEIITKLYDTMKLAKSHEADEVMQGFADLVVALLRCPEEEGREEATLAVLRSLPMSAQASCLAHSLGVDNTAILGRTLDMLPKLLRSTNSSKAFSWDDGSVEPAKMQVAQRGYETQFLQGVGTLLCSIAVSESRISDVRLKKASVEALEELTFRYGSSSPASVQLFADLLHQILRHERSQQAVSSPAGNEDICSYLSTVLTCLSSFIASLKKQCVRFIPFSLQFSVKILQVAFGSGALSKDDMEREAVAALVTLAESAIRVCTSVLDACPAFFGRKPLQDIASLCASCDVEVLTDLFGLAMEKTSAGTTVTALDGVLGADELEVSLSGISTLMGGVKLGVGSMQRSELKLYSEQLLRFVLQALEYGRGESLLGVNDGDQEDEKEEASVVLGYQRVDESSAEALTAMVLKLSESDFKSMFNKLMQWCNGGALSDELAGACEVHGVSVEKNVLRALPFYRVTVKMFEVLQAIMVPYFLALLDKVIDIIALNRLQFSHPKIEALPNDKNHEQSAKKRKRSNMEQDTNKAASSVLCQMQSELCDVCLDNLLVLLKQKLDSNVMSAQTTTRIRVSLLTAFDQKASPSKLKRAFCRLASRIVAAGDMQESKDECRGLLVDLSRGLLQRTREDDVMLRKSALDCVREIAGIVGDEWLVTLPESMPFLAEVVDDEDDDVRKAALAVVSVFEELSGEKILDQLK